MKENVFHDIPEEFKSMLERENIRSQVIMSLYSHFTFNYLNFMNPSEKLNKAAQVNLGNSLFDKFQEFKFLTYQTTYFDNPGTKEEQSESKSVSQIYNVVICVEKECFMIDHINQKLFDDIIQSLIERGSSIISTNDPTDEVDTFCKDQQFKSDIKNNFFIKATIKPILTYMIRRFYYPTDYFKDPSFFIFEDLNQEKIKENEIKNKISHFLIKKHKIKSKAQQIIQIVEEIKKNEENIDDTPKMRDFKEEEFFVLKSNRCFKLALHLSTFYIFWLKEVSYGSEMPKNLKHELEFCTKYSHRCFVKCYGLIRKEERKNKTIFFVYEFMSNGSLQSLHEQEQKAKMDILIQSNQAKKRKTKIDKLMEIERISQGIYYLHSNKLIHRDLKPENILIDHDFLPFISDFETIRSIENDEPSEGEFTNDIGSLLYASPEQEVGRKVSYPTDIYSFGLIIYYVNENKHMRSCNGSNIYSKSINDKILPMNNVSDNLEELYESCVEFSEEKRIKTDKIPNRIIEEVGSFVHFKKYLNDLEISNQFVYETITMQKNNSGKLKQCIINLIFSTLRYLNDMNYINRISKVVADIYYNGDGVERNCEKAVDYYELSAKHNSFCALFRFGGNYTYIKLFEQEDEKANEYYKLLAEQNNSYVISRLKDIYSPGDGVEQNFKEEIEYYELLSKLNYSYALSRLGDIYYTGDGVEQNSKKAIEYYEPLAKKNNSYALSRLGDIYYYGDGVEQDYKEAIKYYELSAKQNNSYALSRLGDIYYYGKGVEQNFMNAIKYYELLAKQNNSYTLSRLGDIYYYGKEVERNYEKAIKYYELSAKQNNSDALCKLGNIYYNGIGVKQDYKKFIEYYELLAKQCNPDALYRLGDIYYYGDGVEHNYKKAVEYYELSAKQNNSYAQFQLRNIYYIDSSVEQNYEKGVEYYEPLAKQNNSYALYQLGNIYYYGYGVERNYGKAIEYYELSAKQNNSDALYRLGNIYYYGHGVEPNCGKAIEYYELLANKNNSYDLYRLGDIYYYGYGVERNYEKAIEYYELSAKQNNSDALYRLGNIYYYGDGIEPNCGKAIEYYELLTKHNNSDSFNQIGDIYLYGKGVEQNYGKAIEYYKLSAKQNNSYALFRLGDIYYTGKGIKKNYKKAIEYYELLAKQNNSYALFRLGNLYFYGNGVKQDYEKAIEYYELLAKQNNSEALYLLGNIYYTGKGIKKNYKKAIEYYELSAKQNNSYALSQLGDIYYYGNGIEQNYEKAIEYYELLAKQNNYHALNQLGNIYSRGVKPINKNIINYYSLRVKLKNDHDAAKILGYIYETGDGVPVDKRKAQEMYELSIELGNSDALICLGHLYIKEKEYEKAKKCFERSAKKNNYKAFYYLGNLYLKGIGFQKNYLKAKEYYYLSIQESNPDSYFKLGYLYYHGYGVKQNYMMAKDYFELSAKQNKPVSLFYLGNFHSSGEFFEIDFQKSIVYFEKCIEIEEEYLYSSQKMVFKHNNFRYIAYNDLGLIYLISIEDKKKGTDYLKESAFAEYPYGQNNFGLVNQLYLDNTENAKHMYERSSEHNFSIAQYNLGYLFEQEKKIDESIKCYIKASENEDSPLTFRSYVHQDKRLEISKTFIICLTNLKLTKHYLIQSDFNESKKYFNRTFRKLTSSKDEGYKFQLYFNKKQIKESFSYIKSFILSFPSFNLRNQSIDISEFNINFLHPKQTTQSNATIENKKIDSCNAKNKNKIYKNKENHNHRKHDKENNYSEKSIKLNIESTKENNINNKYVFEKVEEHDDKVFYDDPNKLFEFIINNSESKYTEIFVGIIEDIISIMSQILYTPPYAILFGRINIEKPKTPDHSLIEINELFYEGFGIDI